ncbi:MAG: DNA-processing protein DprA [Clostridiales bacterium]|jgi:predicted Rossmann fold nucleotide-binding protein DprA/Smf involved in DNA uptake|nr:DNA-processing protein DprA [Clostridiales bacterium]
MNLTNNAKAAVLLCSYLSINSVDVSPFTIREWNDLAKKLLDSSVKEPAGLISLSAAEIKAELNISSEMANRICKLLARGGNLAFSLEELERKAIFIVTRGDKEYPARLKQILGKNSPVLLYYCGDISLVNHKSIAIVGSRNIDIDGGNFARQLSEKAIREGYAICSGGAKGIDQISEETALSKGGYCVSFLSDSMSKKIRLKLYRENIAAGRMLLISAVNPDAPFNVANAMNRNKYIYALSQSAFVIAADYNKGGTWSGAVENIKHEWVNTYVWDNTRYKGNAQLIRMGALPLRGLEEFSAANLLTKKQKAGNEQITLFSMANSGA